MAQAKAGEGRSRTGSLPREVFDFDSDSLDQECVIMVISPNLSSSSGAPSDSSSEEDLGLTRNTNEADASPLVTAPLRGNVPPGVAPWGYTHNEVVAFLGSSDGATAGSSGHDRSSGSYNVAPVPVPVAPALPASVGSTNGNLPPRYSQLSSPPVPGYASPNSSESGSYDEGGLIDEYAAPTLPESGRSYDASSIDSGSEYSRRESTSSGSSVGSGNRGGSEASSSDGSGIHLSDRGSSALIVSSESGHSQNDTLFGPTPQQKQMWDRIIRDSPESDLSSEPNSSDKQSSRSNSHDDSVSSYGRVIAREDRSFTLSSDETNIDASHGELSRSVSSGSRYSKSSWDEQAYGPHSPSQQPTSSVRPEAINGVDDAKTLRRLTSDNQPTGFMRYERRKLDSSAEGESKPKTFREVGVQTEKAENTKDLLSRLRSRLRTSIHAQREP